MGLKERLLEELKNFPKDLIKDHGWIDGVLIGLNFRDGHVHMHYPGEDEITGRIWNTIAEHKGYKKSSSPKPDHPAENKERATAILTLSPAVSTKGRKIIFSHNRAAGDALMFSAGIRDFKLLFPDIEINVESNQSWIWENNPYINRNINKNDPGVEYYRVGYPAVGYVNNSYIHFSMMFLLDMIAVADLHSPLGISAGEFCATFANGEVGDPCLGKPEKNPASEEPFISLVSKYRGLCKEYSRQRGDLHLSDHEKSYNMIKEVYGVNKYWVIAPGGKRDGTTKIWDWRRFSKVVEHFKGRLTFVMIGRSDHLIEPLDGVINLVDKTKNLRELVPVVYHSDGCISGPSLLLHLSAAIPPRIANERKPCVFILGGREPSAWTWYCNHQVIHTNGAWSCCSNGGCWKSRTVPIAKDPAHNDSLCKRPVKVDDRTIQGCMEQITAEDVIRRIEMYYQGDIYVYGNAEVVQRAELQNPQLEEQVQGLPSAPDPYDGVPEVQSMSNAEPEKCINFLGNLNTKGGGEQSLLTLAETFNRAGWKVKVFPWSSVHDNYQDHPLVQERQFKDRWGEHIVDDMFPNAPLLFYSNDCVWDFPEHGQLVVEKSSCLILGLNWMIGHFKDPSRCDWLIKSGKLKAVIVQNQEKKEEWENQVVGFPNAKVISLFGAINIDKYYEVCTKDRENDKSPFVVLKHCVDDNRKYVTKASEGKGDKIHIWQKHLSKELDTKFYARFLKDIRNIKFEFMEAPRELKDAFKNESRMVFHKWDAMPVPEFLSRGHVYLYRTSNDWRDNYPRVVAEALAAGLPVLSEPRDGTKDRIQYGDTGFYCVDYDGFLYALRLLQRKEKLRRAMGIKAKEWAKNNLDPKIWVKTVEEILNESSLGHVR